MGNLINDILAKRHLKDATKKLRRLERDFPYQGHRFIIPFVFRGKGHFKSIYPKQNLYEIERLYQLVCSLKAKNILEIGTGRGGTLYLWIQAADEKAKIMSIDLPGGDFGGGYPRCRIPFYQSFGRAEQRIYLLLGDSHSSQAKDRVLQFFGKQQIDFLFIDGDHTYQGVRNDYELYGSLVRSGGIIALHDILPRQDDPKNEVFRLWNLLKRRFETIEFLAPEGAGRRIGIGCICVP
jgi:predicted O-methyltransferase YrrM